MNLKNDTLTILKPLYTQGCEYPFLILVLIILIPFIFTPNMNEKCSGILHKNIPLDI